MLKYWKQVGAISICAILVFSVFAAVRMNTHGEIFSTAAVREYNPDATEIFIDDNLVPLASDVNANNTQAIDAQIQIALDATNQKRSDVGLSSLKWDSTLAQCAAVRAAEATSNWSYTRPNGTQWYTVNSQVQYGENLAKSYQDGSDVVDDWMASPTHKANLLASNYKTVGIAVYNYNGQWYWAQEFGY
jgi:uncharacterized protein YkwD